MTGIFDVNQHILPFSAKKPVICPYCTHNATFKDNLWRCDPCNALGRADKQTRRPLGTLANNALWSARKRVHQSYGALLQFHIDNGLSKTKARSKVNVDICKELNIEPTLFNLDRFDEKLCSMVLDMLSEMRKSCIPICPYCSNPSVFINSKKIYRCEPCDAQVGVHKHNNQPLGSLANAELRAARKKAHSYFDPLWRYKVKRDSISVSRARESAYLWLASEMDMSVEDCHIGEFDVQQCSTVMRICKPYIGNVMQHLQAL